jgi:hypothetical protein
MATSSTKTRGRKTAQKQNNGGNRADAAEQARRVAFVQKNVVRGKMTVRDAADQLGMQAGKVAFIRMQILVENGTVPAITGKTEDVIIANVIRARDKADEFSSWGWLSARSGIGESTLKIKVEETGQTVKGTNVATERKATREAAKPRTNAKQPRAAKAAATSARKSTGKTRQRRAANPS